MGRQKVLTFLQDHDEIVDIQKAKNRIYDVCESEL